MVLLLWLDSTAKFVMGGIRGTEMCAGCERLPRALCMLEGDSAKSGS